MIDGRVASLPRSSGRAVIEPRAADRIGIAAHGVMNDQQPGKVLRQGPSPVLDEQKEASEGRSMQVFGPSTTGPAWLLAMASTIPFITTTESPTAQKLLVFALAAEELRY